MELLIEIAIYTVWAVGCLLLMWSDIELIFARFKLRQRLKALRAPKKELPQPLRYIEKLINVSFVKESSKKFFILSEGLIFVIAYLLSFRNYNPLLALLISVLSITLPLLLLATKLETGRSKASHEGISMVSELFRQYRINKLNMYEAIQQTVNSDSSYKLSSKRLYMLLVRLRSACGNSEIEQIIDEFVFSFNTSWAKMLGQCIKLSIENGYDVSAGLSDIAGQLKEANSLEEKRRMLNGEASRMTLLLVPLMYAICMIVAIFYLDMSPKSLIMNQFFTPSGFMLFLLNIFLFLFNLFLLAITNSGKLDI